MQYSDYDSDGYSSKEDADYVPSDDDLSEDDINECEKEAPLNACDDVPRPNHGSKTKTKTKRKRLGIGVRKRKKGVLKADEEEEEDGNGAKEAQHPLEEVGNPPDEEAERKKKSDDLWASFLSDVGSRPKASTGPASSPSQKEDRSVLKVAPLTTGSAASGPATVTITEVFDFAGEEVRVQKEVPKDSREAKSYMKSQSIKDEEQEASASTPGPSSKRPAGMGSILGHIGGKKPKMSTLEKSKLDWDAFKSEKGITEELATHNRGRDGYVERKRFLERVDHRQFQLEKTVRLNNMKQ
ncbi:craniofacial development protein 1 [Brachionichthys hirsutus]|uniref:craniofacial development protein 1 n=1 Tax=Brachionichthys hirsutus TaxID=412623 RepID=UPI003604F038